MAARPSALGWKMESFQAYRTLNGGTSRIASTFDHDMCAPHEAAVDQTAQRARQCGLCVERERHTQQRLELSPINQIKSRMFHIKVHRSKSNVDEEQAAARFFIR
jgi:hypothetical protein